MVARNAAEKLASKPEKGEQESERRSNVRIEMDLSSDDNNLVTAQEKEAAKKSREEIREMVVAQLKLETRKYLHVNGYGEQLPPWMDYDRQPKATRWNLWMRKLYTLLTDSGSSRPAFWIAQFMMVTILVSTVSFCLETLPAYSEERNKGAYDTFQWIETVTVQFFAADYLLRFISCPNKLVFVFEPFNIIDLVSVVPWYIMIAMESADFGGTAVFRVIRLFRMFRVLKMGGRSQKLLVVLHALQRAVDMLLLMVFFVSLLIMFFSTLMYYAERGTWDEALGYYVRPNEPKLIDGNPAPSPFESIPAGFWWAIVTLMTVGYGDIFPVTTAGKFIACVAVIAGVLTLALPISVIGTTFADHWQEHQAQEAERRKRLKGAAAVNAISSPALRSLQGLLGAHLTNLTDLAGLHGASESVLDGKCAQLHSRLQAVRRQLAVESKAGHKMRALSVGMPQSPAGSMHGLGLLKEQALEDAQRQEAAQEAHERDTYLSELELLADIAGCLDARIDHVNKMQDVTASLLGGGMLGMVRLLAKKHSDLSFLLRKTEERWDSIGELNAELEELRNELYDLQQCEAEATLATPRSPRSKPAAAAAAAASAASLVS